VSLDPSEALTGPKKGGNEYDCKKEITTWDITEDLEIWA
jgi:hypothetical protein